MIERKDIDNLADLARLDLTDKEKESFVKELDDIVAYVSEVQEIAKDDIEPEYGHLVNVNLREDTDPHDSGMYTKDIFEQAPRTEGEYIKVKKIL